MQPLRLPSASLAPPAGVSTPPPGSLLEVPFERYPLEQPEPLADFSLRDYWRVLHAHRWLILSLCALALGLAALFNYLQVPVYRSTATLQIDREQPHTTRLEETLAQPAEQPDYIETQYKILKSRTLAKAVMEKLDLASRAEFRRGWFARRLDPPRRGSELHPAVVKRFLSALTVAPGKGTRLVDLSVDSVDPALAARVANTLAEVYIDQNLAAKWDATQKASGWLTQQLAELKARIERSETDLLNYATTHAIIFVEEQKSITTVKLKQLEEELTRAEAGRIEKQSAYLLAQDAIVRRGPLPGNLNTDTFRELNLKLAELEREQSQLLVTFAPGYPKVERIRSQIEQLERALEAEKTRMLSAVRDNYLAAVEREKLLREAVVRQTRSVNLLGDDIIQYNILKRDAESNRQLYEGLLQRLKEAGVSAGLRASNIRVLDPAEVPETPYRPKKLENLLLALAVGLVVGVALAFVSEHLSTAVRSPEDVERLTGLCLLAVVPRSRFRLPAAESNGAGESRRTRRSLAAGPGGNGDLARWQPGEELVEAYRTLRSSVLLGWEESMRRILITSPQPRDGKTTISLHLAWSLAQLGRRVLLIDADMRKPSCASLLGIESEKGLSDYLEGNAEQDQILLPTSVDNLWLVPAGRSHPEASDLLYSPRFPALLHEAGARWDHVVIDSPPSLALSDARTISRLVEAVILVVSDETERASLQRTKQAFDDAGVRFLGFVMNRVNLNDVAYGYYRDYGYYYYGRRPKPA
ncbi:MAG: polysaccharide biosynthesis tyrosine autokinase [Acidobacteria bacterium]|nr:polysaccharide biosynthesis tyrosine autokinase [Acidobacteriota bacterium]